VSIPGSHSLPSNKQTKYVTSYTTAFHSSSLNSRTVQQSVSPTAAFSITRQHHESKGSLDTVKPDVCLYTIKNEEFSGIRQAGSSTNNYVPSLNIILTSCFLGLPQSLQGHHNHFLPHPSHFITHNLTLRCYAATVTQDVTQFTAASTRFVQHCLVISVKLLFPQYCLYSVSISSTMHALSHSKHFLIIY